MKTKMAICLLLLLAAGCSTPEQDKKRGDARAAMFVECMKLAAQIQRQSDDDVAEVVNACAQHSNYITNYIR